MVKYRELVMLGGNFLKGLKWIILIFTIFVIVYAYLKLGPGSARSNVNHFLSSIIEGNYEKAFDYVYYFDHAYDEDVTIKYGDAKEVWISKVKKLKEEGTYIKSYDHLDLYTDDGYQKGYVKLTVVENGKEKVYEDVSIAFAKKDGQWKIGYLHGYTEDNKEPVWGEAYSGYVGVE